LIELLKIKYLDKGDIYQSGTLFKKSKEENQKDDDEMHKIKNLDAFNGKEILDITGKYKVVAAIVKS
jgi:hypothetical protein